MKKLILLLLVFPFCLSAQKTFYEKLEENGADAEYRCYNNIYKNDKGVQTVSNFSAVYKIKITKEADGLPTGIDIFRKQKDGSWEEEVTNGVREYIKDEGAMNYPMVAMLKKSYRGDRFVAVGDYVFRVNVKDDNITPYDFDNVYILVKEKTDPATNEDGSKKKLSMKEKLAAAKNKLLAEPDDDPLYERKMEEDFDQIIKDYLVAMKAKQASYTPTAKEKADAERLSKMYSLHAADVKAYNDSIFATPEYQAALKASKEIKLKTRSSVMYAFVKFDNGSISRSIKVTYGDVSHLSCSDGMLYYNDAPVFTGAKQWGTLKGNCDRTITIP